MDGYTESQKKIITTAHTFVASVVIVVLVAMIAWAFLKGLSVASRAVIPVATGFFLALFFKPYYLWLEKKVRVPVVALLLLSVTVLLPISLLVWWAGAIIMSEIVDLVKEIPVMMGRSLDWIGASFPSLQGILEQVKIAFCWFADSIMGLVGATPQVDVSAAGAGSDQFVVSCANYGEAISNTVAAVMNTDAANMMEICTNADLSAVQTTAGSVNLSTEKLGELYAAYGDQLKKVGADIIQAGCEKLGHPTTGGSRVAAAATASAGYGGLGWAYAGASGVMMKIGAGAAAVFKWLVYVLVTVIFFVYFLMTKNFCGGKIAEAIPMLKDKTRKIIANQIDTMIDILVSFYQRQILICLVEGFFYGIGFWIVGLPYGFFIGLMLGTLNLIPFFGSIVCLPLALTFAYFSMGGSGLKVVLVLVVWGIGQFLDGYFITPKIQGNRTGLGYAGVIFSFLFWTMFLGPLLGMLLAIPLSACFVVLWRTFCKLTRTSGIL